MQAMSLGAGSKGGLASPGTGCDLMGARPCRQDDVRILSKGKAAVVSSGVVWRLEWYGVGIVSLRRSQRHR
jgi:hypothetical protein